MKEWILFGLFLIVGLGMLIGGIFYMRKEKEDTESVKIYRNVSIIGICLGLGSVLFKIFF